MTNDGSDVTEVSYTNTECLVSCVINYTNLGSISPGAWRYGRFVESLIIS